MFKVIEITSLLWPVEINVPRTDGSGEHDVHEIKVEYKTYDADELKELADGNSEASKNFKVEDQILGWDGIYDAKGEPIKYSKQTLKKLMKTPFLSRGLIQGFWLCQEGYAGKNS